MAIHFLPAAHYPFFVGYVEPGGGGGCMEAVDGNQSEEA
jgi:hypothetical protein